MKFVKRKVSSNYAKEKKNAENSTHNKFVRKIEMQQVYLKFLFIKYCYEDGNGVLKMINKSSKNKTNGFVYMINE